MDYLYNELSYLKGLAEGLNVDETTNEGKLMLKMLDALELFAFKISDLEEEIDEINEILDDIDEDLNDFDNFLYEEDLMDEFECPVCGSLLFLDEDDFDEDGNLEIICPECGEEYIIDNDLFDYSEDELCDCNCECEE